MANVNDVICAENNIPVLFAVICKIFRLSLNLIIKCYFEFNLKIRSRFSHKHPFIKVVSPFKEVFIRYNGLLGLNIDPGDFLYIFST